MKNGTWGIKGNVNKKIVKLEIVLIKQEGKLRAVPEITSKKYSSTHSGYPRCNSHALQCQKRHRRSCCLPRKGFWCKLNI